MLFTYLKRIYKDKVLALKQCWLCYSFKVRDKISYSVQESFHLISILIIMFYGYKKSILTYKAKKKNSFAEM